MMTRRGRVSAAVTIAVLVVATSSCGRNVPVLGIGDTFTTRFKKSDLTTSDLTAEYGINEGTLQTVAALAKPDNCLDAMGMPAPCYRFSVFGCGGDEVCAHDLCGTRWIVAQVDNPGAATVRASATDGNRDFMLYCEAPDGTSLFTNDDFDVTFCKNDGTCDPGLALTGAGTWTCFFTVSPYDTDFFCPNEVAGGKITITVTSG